MSILNGFDIHNHFSSYLLDTICPVSRLKIERRKLLKNKKKIKNQKKFRDYNSRRLVPLERILILGKWIVIFGVFSIHKVELPFDEVTL